ncbi:hypothetical protein [Sanguibacter suaedae]|uniref:Glycosyl transferase family 3 domain-containing protein n=1 Tax=Sanguibacter suaedae TaxID=2795737 RepID=A0A934IC62_9MICO|nr:hypothetical protein [Sanguibacter suaedae]MBI9115253.1 hypothetical protein [Sanguibacter suaedae]
MTGAPVAVDPVPVTDVRDGDGGRPVDWVRFWEGLDDGTATADVLVGTLAAVSQELPDDDGLVAFVRSVVPDGPLPAVDAVNIVGIGGGPSTMNVSTAAAVVAAAAGAAVVKSGSRAYTSVLGSTELLGLAGVATTTSTDDLRDRLARHRLAFAGQHVYPRGLTRLARRIVPVGMKEFGGFLNVVGPYLPALGLRAQVTGRSGRATPEAVRRLATGRGLTQWVCSSDLGADELLSVCPSTVTHPDGRTERIVPGTLVTGAGSLEDLRPAEPGRSVEHFAAALAGDLAVAVTETIVLNAAVVLLASGTAPTLRDACASAHEAISSGAAHGLFETLRGQAPAGAAVTRDGRGGADHGVV